MPDIQFSSNVGLGVDGLPENITSAASLGKFLVAKGIHLLVVPDLVKAVKQTPTEAAGEKPLQFQLTAAHDFQFAGAQAAVDFTPSAQVVLGIDAVAGSDLFDDEPYGISTTVPEKTAYVSLSFTGSVDVGVSGAGTGDLTPGFDIKSAATFRYFRAFPTDSAAGEPTVGTAIGETAKNFIIPAAVADLGFLGLHDVAAVSGRGSLTLSAKLNVSIAANPLASIELPLKLPAVTVQSGVMGSLGVSFAVEGSYQVRVEKTGAQTVRLIYSAARSHNLTLRAGVSGGVRVGLGDQDLAATLLQTVFPSQTAKKAANLQAVLEEAGLGPSEISTLSSAIKSGLNRSLTASINEALSGVDTRDSVFEYELELDELDARSTALVSAALHGDLSGINGLEPDRAADGTLAPGIRFVSSALGKIREQTHTLALNLLGIFNFVSVSEFTGSSEILTDASGTVTIKEVLRSDRISALDNFTRDIALQKALFDSAIVTMAHAASGALNLQLAISAFHFAYHSNTNLPNFQQYAAWFDAFGLSGPDAAKFATGGQSTCLIRTVYDESRSLRVFLDQDNHAHPRSAYFEAIRAAIESLLDPGNNPADEFRRAVLQSPPLLQQLVEAGTGSNQSTLLNPAARVFLGAIHADVFTIATWSDAMAGLAKALETFIANRGDADAVRAKFGASLKNMTVEFGQPVGILALSSIAGARKSGRIWTNSQTFETSVGAQVRGA